MHSIRLFRWLWPVAFFSASVAVAQDAVLPPPAAEPQGHEVAPKVPTESAQFSERVEKLEKLAERYEPLKFSGFVQAQYVRNDLSSDGVDSSGKPLNKNLFELRRARLRATYTLGIAEFVLNIDAIPAGVTVKEAEASVTVPFTEAVKTKLTAGLFYIPFGYETQESDSVLNFIERSSMSNRLFPGSRDLGIRAQGDLFDSSFVYQIALMNGNPIGDSVFAALDPNSSKDVVGRIGVRLGTLRLGVSGLWGKGYLPPATDDTKTMDVDESRGYRNFTHRAAGFDIVYTVELPVLGELAFYAEGALAHDLDRSRLADYPKPVQVSSDGKKVAGAGVVHANQAGGYVGFLQHLGPYAALGARAELFDPNVEKHRDTFGALTLVANVYPHSTLRFTAGYSINFEAPSVKNNVLTLRGQVKF